MLHEGPLGVLTKPMDSAGGPVPESGPSESADRRRKTIDRTRHYRCFVQFKSAEQGGNHRLNCLGWGTSALKTEIRNWTPTSRGTDDVSIDSVSATGSLQHKRAVDEAGFVVSRTCGEQQYD